MTTSPDRWLTWCFRRALALYPKSFRAQFGESMVETFLDQIHSRGDVRQFRLSDDVLPHIYARSAQNPGLFMTLVVETAGDPMALKQSVSRAVWDVDPAGVLRE